MMSFDTMIDELVRRLNAMRQNAGKPPIKPDEPFFCLDSDIKYESGIVSVSRKSLLRPRMFYELVRDTLAQGPSWIHGDLSSTSDGAFVVAIRFGALVGNPAPSLNVSGLGDVLIRARDD